jgi:hypothetical protein
VRRGALVAFGALVAATVAAFFVTQHLKVSSPLLQGFPSPTPATINPYGATCQNGQQHSRMFISFYLQHRADDVDVYVVDESGTIVRTLATGRHMRRNVRYPDGYFTWNGREDNGAVAPDGTYYLRVALLGQGRTIQINKPITIKTAAPHPSVRSVSPSLIPRGGAPVRIRYSGNENRDPVIRIYRTDLPGSPRLVEEFGVSHKAPATWDGTIAGQPAPAGTYLIGLQVTDAACNVGRFPVVLPPPPGTTPHAGVTVRYIGVEPQLDPVPAGTHAMVLVDARGHGFHWVLWRAGARKPTTSGGEDPGSYLIRARPPLDKGPGLYELSVNAGPHLTHVPVVVNAAKGSRKILVVLPALTWQGQNPVDDPPQDGLPNTLDNGGPVALQRVFANGLPADWGDISALLTYLDRNHLGYDLTTDIGLIDGRGPTLSGHKGVVLAGTERWLPNSLMDGLKTYVANGGHLLSLGIGSLQRRVTIRSSQAVDPTAPSSADVFGARPGPVVNNNHDLITVIRDGLGIFNNTSGAYSGYRAFQPISPPETAKTLSEAGTATTPQPAIAGFGVGKGFVVDMALVGFAQSLQHNVDGQDLIRRLWTVLAR